MMEGNTDKSLKELEEAQSEESDFPMNLPPDIVAYNELRSCSDIFRMHDKGQLNIKVDFQRDIVWKNPEKTRFIDSLIKQLPIPSMCISLDYKNQNRLVIDGLQRINTIIEFLDKEKQFQLSQLDDIDPRIAGKTNHEIREKDSELYERVENLTIPITVIRCNTSKPGHMEYLYTIFHRLNTGGVKLNNQEIRNCICHGNFNDLLKELAKNKLFVSIYGESYRFSNEEKFLRFVAFSKTFEAYPGKLAKYLNDFMFSKKNASNEEITSLREEIVAIHTLIKEKITLPENYSSSSKALHEALYVGIQRNLNVCLDKTEKVLNNNFSNLSNDVLFSSESLKEGLSRKEKVIERLNRAIEILRGE